MSGIDTKLADAALPSLPKTAAMLRGLGGQVMNLKPLGRIIQAIFLATVHLGEKMSTIVCSSSAMLRCKNVV